MEPGPTEFDTGRSWFLLSRYYRVAHGAGPIPNETQFRCRTLGACLQTTANQKPRKRLCGGGTSSACNASLALDLGGEGDGWGPSPTDTPPSGRSGGGLRRPVRLPGVPTAAPPTSGTVPYHSATATHPPPPRRTGPGSGSRSSGGRRGGQTGPGHVPLPSAFVLLPIPRAMRLGPSAQATVWGMQRTCESGTPPTSFTSRNQGFEGWLRVAGDRLDIPTHWQHRPGGGAGLLLGGGGFGMTPWYDDLVCSGRRLLADRHLLDPFPP